MKPPSPPSPTAARLLAAALLAASASPALAVTPFKMRIPIGLIAAAAPNISIPGYNPLTGMVQSPIGSFTWDGTASTYTVPSGTAFGFTGPVTLTLAATADEVKTSLQLTPAAVAGTLAGGFLLGHFFEFDGSGWIILRDADPNDLLDGYYYRQSSWPTRACYGTASTCGAFQAALEKQLGLTNHLDFRLTAPCFLSSSGSSANCPGEYLHSSGIWYSFQESVSKAGLAISTTRPATADDWGALPDPLPAVGGELPYAPYMPSGVAVQNNFTINDLSTGTVHHCTNGGCD